MIFGVLLLENRRSTERFNAIGAGTTNRGAQKAAVRRSDGSSRPRQALHPQSRDDT
jgi:hypothetical protein